MNAGLVSAVWNLFGQAANAKNFCSAKVADPKAMARFVNGTPKLRPPLIFTRENADLFLAAFGDVLDELS